MNKKLAAFGAVALLVSSCANMDNTQQRTLSGGAIGAAAGAMGAAIFEGNPFWGAVGGAAVGAASGFAYDQYERQLHPRHYKHNDMDKKAPRSNAGPNDAY